MRCRASLVINRVSNQFDNITTQTICDFVSLVPKPGPTRLRNCQHTLFWCIQFAVSLPSLSFTCLNIPKTLIDTLKRANCWSFYIGMIIGRTSLLIVHDSNNYGTVDWLRRTKTGQLLIVLHWNDNRKNIAIYSLRFEYGTFIDYDEN